MKIPVDPNVTLEVNNDKLESLLTKYAAEKTAENLGMLITHLQSCRVLVPANLNSEKQPIPCFIRSAKDEFYLPVYTNKNQIPDKPRSPAILNIPYPEVNRVALKQGDKVAGVVINPFSNNLLLLPELLRRIEEVNAAHAGQPKVKQVQMTEAEYIAFEQGQFVYRFLPKHFFEGKQTFVDDLCERKEEKVDMLYEESYQQKRLYPYLTEEFSVMAMHVSGELLMVRIDFPVRNPVPGSCYRAYLTWEALNQRGRYFTIEKGPEGALLGEVSSALQHTIHGEAPMEGAELQKLMDLLQDERRHTS